MDAKRKRRNVFARLRALFLTALLGLLLVLVNAVLGGCESDEEPQVYYGPPPVDGGATDAVFDSTDPPVYYGPIPVDVVDDVAVYYGPQPVDAVEDVPAPEDVPAVYYGPPPVDAVSDVPAPEDVPAVYYGPPPVDAGPTDVPVSTDCEPAAYYGPPPCDSDDQCVEWYGPGWYCDPDYTFEDPCGQPVTWPMCVEEQEQ